MVRFSVSKHLVNAGQTWTVLADTHSARCCCELLMVKRWSMLVNVAKIYANLQRVVQVVHPLHVARDVTGVLWVVHASVV